jgi:hypothetical protein
MRPQFDPPVSVSVLGLRSAVEDEEIARMMTVVLRRAADAYRVTGLVHSGVEDDLAPLMLVYECEQLTPSCLMQIGDAMLTDYFVYGLIEPESGRADTGYAMTLSLYNVHSNQVERTLREAIPRDAAGEVLDAMARRFYGAVSGTELPGTLSIVCEVQGAEVLLGEELLGRVGAETLVIDGLEPGGGLLTVRHEGHQPWERQVNIEAGRTTEIAVELRSE